MRRSTVAILSLLALALVLVVAGCGGSKSSSSSGDTGGSTEGGGGAETASTAKCTPGEMETHKEGVLTVATDKPAYPPYFEDDEPENGEGFESAVGYAIADKLGFDKADVTWIVVPFANSFAPGPKTFDIDLNQVNYKTERTQTADLTKGYYFGNQALVVLKDSPLAKATTIAELKDGVYGAQVGTTSYDSIATVIAPSKPALVYDTNDLAIKALGNKTIDGVMVDLPTADYIANVQVQNATIVGQFEGGTPEYFSAVLGKGSTLTPCVDAAIDSLTADGTLDKLASTWLPFQDSVPVIKP